jgi:hypothetical protein
MKNEKMVKAVLSIDEKYSLISRNLQEIIGDVCFY